MQIERDIGGGGGKGLSHLAVLLHHHCKSNMFVHVVVQLSSGDEECVEVSLQFMD